MVNWREYIVSDPKILLGKPTIKGTRLSVEFIVGLFAGGWTEDMVLENYPGITKIQIMSVFAFVQDWIKDGLMFDLPVQKAA